MRKVRVAIQVDQDKKVATVEIEPPGEPLLKLVVELDELDRLIGELGKARSHMVTGQPYPDFDSEGAVIDTVGNPSWCIKASPPAGALFAFYHPKFGPVGATLSGDDIRNVISFLTDRFILHPTKSSKTH